MAPQRIHQKELTTNNTIRFIQPHEKLHQLASFVVCFTLCSNCHLILSKASNLSLDLENEWCVALKETILKIFPNFMSSVKKNNTICNIRGH
ncbi:hypothetical protein GYH30_039644 [Glycine max]|nr:hypothetical protein GYH30_039644 [Glycine max]